MSHYWTATDIIKRAGVEIGLPLVTDPFASNDQSYQQLRYLLDAVGQELVFMYDWEQLVKETSIDTTVDPSGVYDLPDDFAYMIPQTGWERAENVPLYGPLSAQDWQYLLGRDLVSYTIYASFRLQQSKFTIFPQPAPEGLDIHYEYINHNWVQSQTAPGTFSDTLAEGSDLVLYEPILAIKFLKVKFLEAKGFDSTKARDDFATQYDSITGNDKSAPILNAGGLGRRFPYIDGFYNTPDTRYGLF